MRRLKVVIADDEERICRLIQALADWEALGLCVAAVAHNGVEACEAVRRVEPDILITDIRMPGYSGLELIKRVKELFPELEIIIISGYAHFEYAQQAIKFGVGYYLLKPISKAELNATLDKLKKRIAQRMESESDRQELLRKAERDDRQLRQKLIRDLMDREEKKLTLESLREQYHLQVGPGLFQIFFLKMDRRDKEVSRASADVLMTKAQELLEQNLREKCRELLLYVRENNAIGFLHYSDAKREELRRSLKNCLNLLEVQKNLFQPVAFSMSVGRAVSEPEEIRTSLKEAKALIEERLVKGTGRLLERMGEPSALAGRNLLDGYLREVTKAVELMDLTQSGMAVGRLLGAVREVREVRGCEILELVYSAADIFAVKAQISDRTARLEEFRRECGQCGSVEQLFSLLEEFQRVHIQERIDRHEDETVRPVRKAKQYIQNHYSEQITLEEVSDAVGLSAAYFSTLFKKTEGEGFAKYLIHVRMEQARVFLRESNLPVTEICRRVGYNDLKHFTRTFEKTAGVKPSVYRKLYG